jgi:hypothetical protein
MDAIVSPVDKSILEEELSEAIFIRSTNNGHNKIYVFTAHDSPNLMREVGRLREITFHDAGGGTGKELDIDQFDLANPPFQQLIVWDPDERAIVGGYRFIHGRQISCNSSGCLNSPTAELFAFSEKFVRDYLPLSIELGRSFVQPEYQPTINLKKGLYSLDNLWDGLGAMIIDHPDIKYFFGKMTMYPDYNRTARDIVLRFLGKHFPDKEHLMVPKIPLKSEADEEFLEHLFVGDSFEENYRILVHEVRTRNENIPPLFNAYMNLSPTMMTFGTSLNHEFGEVEETGILVNIGDIYPRKKDRHLASYIRRLTTLKNLKLRRKK